MSRPRNVNHSRPFEGSHIKDCGRPRRRLEHVGSRARTQPPRTCRSSVRDCRARSLCAHGHGCSALGGLSFAGSDLGSRNRPTKREPFKHRDAPSPEGKWGEHPLPSECWDVLEADPSGSVDRSPVGILCDLPARGGSVANHEGRVGARAGRREVSPAKAKRSRGALCRQGTIDRVGVASGRSERCRCCVCRCPWAGRVEEAPSQRLNDSVCRLVDPSGRPGLSLARLARSDSTC
jgi:hypothetical protein